MAAVIETLGTPLLVFADGSVARVKSPCWCGYCKECLERYASPPEPEPKSKPKQHPAKAYGLGLMKPRRR